MVKDPFLVGVVQGGSLAHIIAAPVLFALAVTGDSPWVAMLALVMLVVGVYVREHTLDWTECNHSHVRCVHGDEIIAVGYKRSRCLDCGRCLNPLPEICSVTGEVHR